MFGLFRYIETIAPTPQPVLITGETGVGKELVARAIHKLSGLRGSFIAVNVAGLDDNVFSDTLFGHARGAFTGADRTRSGLIKQASGGTLFLDEMGDLSSASQLKLLRLLQEGEYMPLGQDTTLQADTRILAATNQDLWALQKVGRFRKDLNYRLRAIHINVPPLRERVDDIRLLMEHFFEEASRALDKKKPTPPKELLTLLETYNYPGNIRELRAMVFDAVSRHESKILSLQAFKAHIAQHQQNRGNVPAGALCTDTERDVEGGDPLIDFSGELPTITQATQLLVGEAMKRSNANQSVAARLLGISQQALSRRLKKQEPSILKSQMKTS